MQTKSIEYQGKIIKYFHQPHGGVTFYSKDFFNILGMEMPSGVLGVETLFINYQVALIYAERNNEEFADWLKNQNLQETA